MPAIIAASMLHAIIARETTPLATEPTRRACIHDEAFLAYKHPFRCTSLRHFSRVFHSPHFHPPTPHHKSPLNGSNSTASICSRFLVQNNSLNRKLRVTGLISTPNLLYIRRSRIIARVNALIGVAILQSVVERQRDK